MTEYTAGNAAVIVTPAMPGFHKLVDKQLQGIVPLAAKAGDDAGQKTAAGFHGALQRSLAGGKRIAGVVDKAMTGAGVAGAAALGAGFHSALNIDAARGKLTAQLGLTSKEAARVGKVAGQLFAANYGDSMDDVQGAIKSVIQNMDGLRGASAAALKDTTARAITVAKVMDADVGEVTRSVAQLMRTGLAKNSKQAFDIIARGSQLGADKAGDLLDTLNEYGTQFRKVGITGSKAMGLIVQGLRAGARDSDIVADAIKEFSIRAVDGSKTTADGFKLIGLSAGTMSDRIGKGGKSASDGLQLTLDRLRAIKDPVKQSQAAVALFGTQAEDLGKSLYALDPSSATQALGQVGGAADKAGDAMGNTAQAKFETFKRTLQTAVVAAIVNDAIPAVTKLGTTLDGLHISPDAIVKAGLAVGGTVVAWKGLKLAIDGAQAAATGAKAVGKGAGAALTLAKNVPSGWETLRLRALYAGDATKTAGGKISSVATAAGRGAVSVAKFGASLAAAGGKAALSGLSATAGAIGRVASVAWQGVTALGSLVLSYARAGAAAALAAARTVAMTIAQNAVRVATFLWTAAQWLLNAAMSANPIVLIVIAIAALTAGVIYAYTHFTWFRTAVQAAWAGIQAASMVAWNYFLKPIFDAIKFYIMNIVVPYYRMLWSVAKIVWAGIAAAGRVGWAVLQIIFAGIRAGLAVVGVVFRTFLSVGRTVFSTLGAVIMAVWRGNIRGAFDALRAGVSAVRSSFSTAVDAIKRIWHGLEAATRAPVSFVVNTVYNHGIRSAWNTIAGLVHLPQLPALKFAAGGILPAGVLPGYTPGRDVHTLPVAAFSGGESIFRPEFTRAVGTDFVNGGNAAAMRGGVAGVQQFLARAFGGQAFARGGIMAPPVAAFAGGGIFGSIGKAVSGAKNLVVHGASSLLANGASTFAKHILDPILRQIPTPDSTWAKAILSMPRQMISGFLSWLKTNVDPKLGGDATGVVAAARKYVGQGDDRGVDNNNRFTRHWGYASGTPWCALLVSSAIQDAHAGSHYAGYPTAAVAGYSTRMSHVSTGAGRPGDLAVYGGGTGSHINIIAKKVAGGYDTIGGNQNSLVQERIRGGQSAVLRPRGFARGGVMAAREARAVFSRRESFHNADRHEPNAFTAAMTKLRPDVAAKVAGVMARQHLTFVETPYDEGGMIAPGWNLINNATRKPEPVVAHGDWDALTRAAAAGGETHTHYEIRPLRADMTVQDLEALQDRQEALARVGRPS